MCNVSQGEGGWPTDCGLSMPSPLANLIGLECSEGRQTGGGGGLALWLMVSVPTRKKEGGGGLSYELAIGWTFIDK